MTCVVAGWCIPAVRFDSKEAAEKYAEYKNWEIEMSGSRQFVYVMDAENYRDPNEEINYR